MKEFCCLMMLLNQLNAHKGITVSLHHVFTYHEKLKHACLYLLI